MREGVAPYHDESERLGLSRSSWGWDAKIADFDNDGAVEVIQAVGFLEGRPTAGPSCRSWRWATTSSCATRSNWPRFGPGDDLSGHDRNRFAVRVGGRFWDIAADLDLAEPGVSRGIAVADVDGDGALDFAVANQWAASSFYRNKGATGGSFLGLHLLLPVDRDRPGPTRSRPGHPGGDLVGRPARGGIGPGPAAGRPGACKPRSTAATATRGSGASTCISGSALRRPKAALEVELSWRDPAGRVRRESRRLTPGWHTVLLGHPDNRGRDTVPVSPH